MTVLLLTEKHIKQFAWFYLFCFLLNFGWFWWNGLLFSCINPVFFVNNIDFTRNILMLTNLQHLLLQKFWLRVAFDGAFFILPVLLVAAVVYDFRIKKIIAYITIAFTIVYAIFFSSISYVSMQGYMSWILMPVVLSATSVKRFYYYLHLVRIIFITMFVAAAFWKIASGAVFNVEQMSGILLKQHAAYLVSNPTNWFTRFVYFLADHTILAFIFYLAGTLVELAFITGLLTRKYDRLLMAALLAFLFADYFLMQIYYFIWLVFAGCFYFSSFVLQDEKEYN